MHLCGHATNKWRQWSQLGKMERSFCSDVEEGKTMTWKYADCVNGHWIRFHNTKTLISYSFVFFKLFCKLGTTGSALDVQSFVVSADLVANFVFVRIYNNILDFEFQLDHFNDCSQRKFWNLVFAFRSPKMCTQCWKSKMRLLTMLRI